MVVTMLPVHVFYMHRIKEEEVLEVMVVVVVVVEITSMVGLRVTDAIGNQWSSLLVFTKLA